MDQRTHRNDQLKRIAFIALRAVGVVVAVVAICVGGLTVALKSDWGGERLRRQVVASVNRQIQGRLGIGRLSFGGDRLIVWDVTLHDPQGELVAQVARAEVDFRIARLLHHEVRVTAVLIESPHLSVVSDARGSNLAQATAPRKKPAAKPAPPPRTGEEGWVIQLDRFDLANGEVQLVSASPTARRDMIHLTNLRSGISARFATGNGSTDLSFRLDGQSVLAPSGPLAIKAEARVRGDATHIAIDGQLLGGTLEARADVDRQRLDATDALVAIAIPRTTLAGWNWGPLRLDARAHPGAVPTVDLLLSIPGVELTAKGGGPSVFKLDGRLAINDLSLTAQAVQALTAGEPLALAGRGQLSLALEAPFGEAPVSLTARVEGGMEELRIAENTLSGLAITGRAAQDAKAGGEADLRVTIASLVAGATKLGKIQLDGKLRQRDLAATLALAAPAPLSLALAARLDDDRQGLVLSRCDLSYPRVQWRSEGDAHLRFPDQALSLQGLRLRADKQTLAIDAAKNADWVDAHLLLGQIRLDLLPALLVGPGMKLRGALDLDVKASVADQKLAATLTLRTPFAEVDGQFQLPVDPLAGGPLDVSVNVTRLDLAEALRGAALAPRVDGRLTAKLRVTGDAASPQVDLTVTGRDLDVRRPAGATVGAPTVEVGHARIRLTYQNRAAHADLDLASAHGGALRVDAAARVDLGYPGVSKGIAIKKIPVRGKVVAKDLDVAWIAQFNPRVETLGGQVNANAQLAGTLGDPQFVGDVRWKNGKVVATAAPVPPPPKEASRKTAR